MPDLASCVCRILAAVGLVRKPWVIIKTFQQSLLEVSMDQKQQNKRQNDGEVAVKSFVALSPGIGLGRPRTRPASDTGAAQAQTRHSLTPPQMNSAAPHVAVSVATPDAASATGWRKGVAGFSASNSAQNSVHSGQSMQRGFGISVGRRLLAYSLDFMLVSLTIGTALACAVVWQSVQNGLDLSTDWYALPPWQWFSRFHILQILAGFYAVFFAYAILLKWTVGFTLGESLMRASRQPTMHHTARAKRS